MEGSGNKNQINDNIFSREFNFSAGNPFDNKFTSKSIPNTTETSTGSTRRLNGYDSTILNKTPIDQNEGEELSIEYRIKEKEAATVSPAGMSSVLPITASPLTPRMTLPW